MNGCFNGAPARRPERRFYDWIIRVIQGGLQWGSSPKAGEERQGDQGPHPAQPASMGLQPEGRRGADDPPPCASASWSFNGAPARRPERSWTGGRARRGYEASFNGAPARRPERRLPFASVTKPATLLQWGSSPKAGEESNLTRGFESRHLASMGLQPEGRRGAGERAAHPGHVWRASMGLQSEGRRGAHHAHAGQGQVLQASMGLQPEGRRGAHASSLVAEGPFVLQWGSSPKAGEESSVTRSNSARRSSLQWGSSPKAGEEFEPNTCDWIFCSLQWGSSPTAGEEASARPSLSAEMRLQWGSSPKAGEEKAKALRIALGERWLQWGSSPKAGEEAGASRRADGRDRGFNGAPARRPERRHLLRSGPPSLDRASMGLQPEGRRGGRRHRHQHHRP